MDCKRKRYLNRKREWKKGATNRDFDYTQYLEKINALVSSRNA